MGVRALATDDVSMETVSKFWKNGYVPGEEEKARDSPDKVSVLDKLNSMHPKDYEKDLPKPLKFTDLDTFYKGGRHGLIAGGTGAGKTTLLLTLQSRLLDMGHTILSRDDGGLEALYLLPKTPIRVWVPDGCELRLSTPYKCDVTHFDWKRPGEILDRVHEYKYNLVVFDAYCIDPATSAMFWSSLFRQLIFTCMQTPRSKKRKLIFSVDELNDLIQGRGGELTNEHKAVKALITYNMRKLRKHEVTMLASTHRFADIGSGPLSNFSYIYVKQVKGYDAYDFLSKSLTMQNKEVFWATAKDLSRLETEYFYLFDYRGHFDKYTFSDIRREDPDPEAIGVIRSEAEAVDMKDPNYKRKVRVACLTSKGMKSPAIGERLGISASTVRQDLMIMRKEWGITELEAEKES